MGMPGMGAADVAAYATSVAKEEPIKAEAAKKMTVADLKNVVNPTTKYYDKLDALVFMRDETVPEEQRLAVVFGTQAAKLIVQQEDIKVAALKAIGKALA